MRSLGVAIASALLLAGCTEGQRRQMAAAQQQRLAQQQAQNAILVTPGDLSGQRYEILGAVEWPGSGNISLFGSPCDPDRLKREAIARWGSVDAIIGYHEWGDRTQRRCGGTAVRFIQTTAVPTAVPAMTPDELEDAAADERRETEELERSVPPRYAALARSLPDEASACEMLLGLCKKAGDAQTAARRLQSARGYSSDVAAKWSEARESAIAAHAVEAVIQERFGSDSECTAECYRYLPYSP